MSEEIHVMSLISLLKEGLEQVSAFIGNLSTNETKKPVFANQSE